MNKRPKIYHKADYWEGKTFHYVTLIKLKSRHPVTRKQIWSCHCKCGTDFTCTLNRVQTGNTKSCGCWNLEQIRIRNYKHGHSFRGAQSKEHICWTNMKARCLNSARSDYKNYGGRGIKVCDRWINSFSAFLEDLGAIPQGKSEIDRINNDGDYEPSNCRWVDETTQHANQRRYLLRGNLKHAT